MAHQRRTDEELLVVDDFSGVNQVIDELKISDKATPWLYGAFVSPHKTVERIPGKVLVSSATSGGAVFTLHQLDFTDRSLVLVHQASNYLVEDNLDVLTGDVEITPLLPTEPFIF